MPARVRDNRRVGSDRLIPTRCNDSRSLARLAESEAELEELLELDSATDDRALGEAGRLPGISVHELLFGVSYAHIVNAAFTHAHSGGSRFSAPERGAWYAAFELKTTQAEIAFQKSQELIEINWRGPETFEFDDYLAGSPCSLHATAEGAKTGNRGQKPRDRRVQIGTDRTLQRHWVFGGTRAASGAKKDRK